MTKLIKKIITLDGFIQFKFFDLYFFSPTL